MIIKQTVVVVLTVIIALTGPSSAEDESTRDHSINNNSWALQFTIDQWLNLQSFDGMIALKGQISDKSSFRFGIGYEQHFNKNAGDGYIDEYGRYYDLKISLPYLRYPWPDRNIKLFWGIGPEFDYYKSDSGEHTDYFKDWSHYYGIGLVGILGVVWFAIKEVSILAEYQALSQYKIIKRQSPHYALKNAYEWSVVVNRVVFGLSAYF